MRNSRLLAGIVFLALVAGAGMYGARWWSYWSTHVTTEDAYVQATVTLITPRVAGTVVELPIEENAPLDAGTVVARLDRSDFEIGLREAEAAVAQAEQRVEEARARFRAAESAVSLAQAEMDLARRDNDRVEKLARKKVASAGDLDRGRTALRVARARVAAAEQDRERARAALGVPIDAPATEVPSVRRARAVRDRAALLLSYAEIRAPVSGYLATRSVQVGQRVSPGQALMRVVPLAGVYVEANFKETDLTRVRVGQPAVIVADIYPDLEYRGVVDSVAPGTGAAFSLLPPENATGNWIKVVQRIPVKIRLVDPPQPDRPLRVGLSVFAAIDLTDSADGGAETVARRVP